MKVKIIIQKCFQSIVMLDALLTLRQCTSACADLSTFDRSWGISTKCLVPLDKLLTWNLVIFCQKSTKISFRFDFEGILKQKLEQTAKSIASSTFLSYLKGPDL